MQKSKLMSDLIYGKSIHERLDRIGEIFVRDSRDRGSQVHPVYSWLSYGSFGFLGNENLAELLPVPPRPAK